MNATLGTPRCSFHIAPGVNRADKKRLNMMLDGARSGRCRSRSIVVHHRLLESPSCADIVTLGFVPSHHASVIKLQP